MIRPILFALAFLCLGLIPGMAAWADGTSGLKVETVVLETAQGRTAIEAEIADTAETRAKGLMFRASMPQNHGMLFDFGKPKQIAMWMKDTKIPLDMIFADRTGRVIGIAEDTVPYSTAAIAVGEPVKAVLEVNAGTARRIGLKPGGRLIASIFKPGG